MVSFKIVLRISVGILFAFFCSFTVAGYQGLLPVLLDSGVYDSLCHSSNNTTRLTKYNAPKGCSAQIQQLNLMFTVSIGLLNMAALPVGFIVNLIGPRLTSSLGAMLISLGVLIFALSSDNFPAWMAGYILMAIGGPAVAFPLLSLPALIPHASGLIFSLCVAAFDGSSAIMLIIQVIYNQSGYSLQSIFLGYLIFPLCLIFASWFIYDPPPFVVQNCVRKAFCCPGLQEETIPLLNPVISEDNSANVNPIGDDTMIEEVEKELKGPFYFGTKKEILFSAHFVLITAWFAIYLIAKYFYILTLNLQLKWLTGSNKEEALGALVFSILLPASAIFTPITAFILDKLGGPAAVLTIALVSFITGVLSIIPFIQVQFVTMTLFVFNRFFFFGTAPFLMSKFYGDLGTSVFYGIALFIASMISYSNYGWSALSTSNPNNFLPINLTQNTLCLIIGLILGYVYFRAEKRGV